MDWKITMVTTALADLQNMQDQNKLKFYHVIVKHEERYAIWPTEKALPTGWRSVGKQGKKAECLDYVKMVWRTGTCPLNPRKKIDAVSTPALVVVAEKTDPPERLLVDGLSSREHQVLGGIRGGENVKALTLSRSFGWALTWILAGQVTAISAVIFSVITRPEKTAAKLLL
jgi:MbtH protein